MALDGLGGGRLRQRHVRVVLRHAGVRTHPAALVPDARREVFRFIEGWYNPRRRHSSFGYESSPAMTRAHLLGAFDMLVTGNDPREWWNRLTLDRGEEGAAKAVAQLIISKGGKRVLGLIKAEAAGRDVVARADDPKLARLLFDDSLEEFLTAQWELKSIVCEYYEETQVVLEDDDLDLQEPEDEFDPDDPEEDEEEAQNGLSISDLFPGKPRASAQRGAKWTLERVQRPARGFLTVPAQWKEADLENFLWSKWELIDFGFDRPIYLVGKQQRLSESTSDRVDLLARGRSGEHIAIELKIVEAQGGITRNSHRIWAIWSRAVFPRTRCEES